MTTYAQYLTGETNIKHGYEYDKPLVIGFLVEKDDYETRYALRRDGTIFESETALRGNVWFNKKGTRWLLCDTIPADAEFIGQYVDDLKEFINP